MFLTATNRQMVWLLQCNNKEWAKMFSLPCLEETLILVINLSSNDEQSR